MAKKKQIHSAEEMRRFAASFGADLLLRARSEKHATVIALQGELGAGKTTFVQGFARGLGIQENVLSPTFVIIRAYKIPDAQYRIQVLWHIDCYRLESSKDLQRLGWSDLVADPKNIILLEWPERVSTVLPEDAISLNFESIDESIREVTKMGLDKKIDTVLLKGRKSWQNEERRQFT